MVRKTFTIFTGTYNSEKIIHRVFDSLENQTCKDFEWIVIDDNSKDNTVGLLEEFKSKHTHWDIRIVRHHVNTGVATSRKQALEKAKGQYFVTWDHDDVQSFSQLDTFLMLWERHDREDIANIFAKMTDQHGKLLGSLYPEEGYISDYISVHNGYLVGNKDAGRIVEHHVCVKTDKFLEVLKYYEKNNELLAGRYPNGGDVWGMLAFLGYKTIYSNVPVRTYYIAEEGRQTMSTVKRKDGADRIFRNKLLWVNFFNKRLPISQVKWKVRILFAVMMYGLLSDKPVSLILQHIDGWLNKVIALPLYFPASMMANRYKRQ